jgi:hypothetical protein
VGNIGKPDFVTGVYRIIKEDSSNEGKEAGDDETEPEGIVDDESSIESANGNASKSDDQGELF